MAIKRLYVHASQYDAACEVVGAVARSMKVGDPFEPGTQLGPVQNKG
jgi:aldehyde dehydrogenase (NAD+)